MFTTSLIYIYFKSSSCAIASFVSGFLIDADHLIDYYLQEGVSFRFMHFYDYCTQRKFKYLSIIFHSIELAILLWLIIYIFKLGNFWIALAIGFSQHMLFDIIFNRNNIKTHYLYFITLRILKGFRVQEFKR